MPTAPFGSEVVVIPGGSGLTVNVNVLVALPFPLSVNRTVNVAGAATEGVPLMTPVDGPRLNPCGRLPAEIAHETGETAPDAVRVAEYGEPTVAARQGCGGDRRRGVVDRDLQRSCVRIAVVIQHFYRDLKCSIASRSALMVPPLLRAKPVGSAPRDGPGVRRLSACGRQVV